MERLFFAVVLACSAQLFAQESAPPPSSEAPVSPVESPPSETPVSPTQPSPPPPPQNPLDTALDSVDLGHWNTNQFTAVTSALMVTNQWADHSRHLVDWLSRRYQDQTIRSPGWNAFANLQRWCELLAANESKLKLERETLSWFLNDPYLSEQFFNLLSPKDHVPKALELLQTFHQAELARFPQYDALAVAIALVWDDDLPLRPHHQVDAAKVPHSSLTPLERFQFWVDSSEKHLCDYELWKLDAGDLKFIVDATATLPELRWAQSSVHFTRGNFDRAFFSVSYDEGRINRGAYNWPHESYSLQEIKKHGGICVDQAYFAAMAGKANGIPTLYFTGEGRRGGHAWFGYMKNFDRWDMNCGRYQYDKYATGSATDYQTGEVISDHDVAFLAEAFHRTPEFQLSRAHLRQAELFDLDHQADAALAAVSQAIAIAPFNVDAWNTKTRFLETQKSDELTAHLNAMALQFYRYPDIKTECEGKLAGLARDRGDSREAAKLDDQMIRENRNKRHDLSAEVYERQLKECYEKKDFKGGRAVVHDAVMKLNQESGTVFKLVDEYVAQCLRNGEADEALHALTDFKARVKYDATMAGQVEGLIAAAKKAKKNQLAIKKT